jgi:hypothetical protein
MPGEFAPTKAVVISFIKDVQLTLLTVVGHTGVPIDIRYDCWRRANRAMRLLTREETKKPRRRN